MEITNQQIVSTEKTIDITIESEGINYRFRVIVNFHNNCTNYLRDIDFRDKYEVALKNTEKRKFRKFIKEYFENETAN